MKDPLPLGEVPILPNEINDAAKDGTLVVFVGAGVSQLVGIPSWTELSMKVLELLAKSEKINFTYGDLKQLKSLKPKKQLSIATQIAEENHFEINYKKLLKPNKKSEVYQYLNSISCAYITTNYDLLLNPEIPENSPKEKIGKKTTRIWRRDEFLAGKLRDLCTVIHLHGCTEDCKSMIVSTRDYLEHYDHSHVQHFLGELFEKHTVLFLGYGLEESEILEHILRRGQAREQKKYKKRFLLQGFYQSQEKAAYKRLYHYYEKSFGVHLVGYILDYRKYQQLEHVIKDWFGQLKVRKPAVADDFDYVMGVARGE